MSRLLLKEIKSDFFSKRKKEKESVKIWINSTYIMLVSLIVLLLIYYVWTLNVNATKWYNIRQLELEKRSLLIEKELLDVKIAELESLWNILTEDDMKNMEPVEEPDYLVIKEWVQYVCND